MFRNSLLIAMLVCLFVVSTIVSASGSRSTSSFPSTPRVGTASSASDVTYEHGKSLFKGRDPRYGKINYCVNSGNELKKVKGRSLKPYKGGKVDELVDNIYNCDNPSQKLNTVFNSTDMTALVFYLNRRHKLKLTR